MIDTIALAADRELMKHRTYHVWRDMLIEGRRFYVLVELVELTGYSRRTVQRSLAELIALERVRRVDAAPPQFWVRQIGTAHRQGEQPRR